MYTSRHTVQTIVTRVLNTIEIKIITYITNFILVKAVVVENVIFLILKSTTTTIAIEVSAALKQQKFT